MPHTCINLDDADMQRLARDTEIELAGLRRQGDTRDATLKAKFNDATLARFAALGMISDERDRQLAKGWDSKHDDEHKHGEIARAAACFAAQAGGISNPHFFVEERYREVMVMLWPWGVEHDSRSRHTPLENLRVAGALIVAEIERRLRAGERS